MLFLLFWLGASIGSFLNVCIWRLPRGESVVQPPSRCPHCGTRLQPLDLVPLLSQFLLRGKCRYCGAQFSLRYFGIELLTGLLFVLVGAWAGPLGFDAQAGAWTGDWPRLLQGLIFVSTLVVIFWVDYDTRLIQLESVLLLGVAGIAGDAWRTYRGEDALLKSLLPGDFLALPAPLPGSIFAMLIAAGGLWVVRQVGEWVFKKEAMGFGDVILAGGIAAHLGWNATIFTFFFLAATVGAFIGIALRVPHAIRARRWAKKRGRDDLAGALARHAFRKVIPFGPMLAMGGVCALLYGADINTAYLRWVEFANPPQNSSSLLLPP